MDDDRKFALAQALAVAKSRQDVPAAMRLLHRDMLLTSPFGTSARGPAENDRFAFADDPIAEEQFFFDLSSLCAQSGVSTDAVRRTLFGAEA